jgi:DNA-binding NarL/FixJ family response regulator
VMDITMPNLNGVEATRAIAEKAPGAAVVILSMHSSGELVRKALEAGARGYLLKEAAGEEVVRAVRSVASGRRFLGEGVADTALAGHASGQEGTLDALTSRELQILGLIADGKSNAEAAVILGLSPRSVETYRSRMMEKLGLEDLPALVKFAIRHGISSLE